MHYARAVLVSIQGLNMYYIHSNILHAARHPGVGRDPESLIKYLVLEHVEMIKDITAGYI